MDTRASSVPLMWLFSIIFKHVYWYIQHISGERLQDHWSSGLCIPIWLSTLICVSQCINWYLVQVYFKICHIRKVDLWCVLNLLYEKDTFLHQIISYTGFLEWESFSDCAFSWSLPTCTFLLFVDIILDAKLDITGSKTLYQKQIKTNKILAWPVNCSELSLGDWCSLSHSDSEQVTFPHLLG